VVPRPRPVRPPEQPGPASTPRYGERPALPSPEAVPTSIDLHTHSRSSDGVLEPRTLVEVAAATGVRILALTDHDTLAGVRELRAAGAPPLPAGLELVAGVELNAQADGREWHVLGYGLDPADERLEARLGTLRSERRRRFEAMVARLRELGLPIDDVLAGLDLEATDALGRPTIARALVAAGHATSVADAFERFIGAGGPAYVPRPRLDPAAAIALVREAGGLAVLAHPADLLAAEAPLRDLVAAGLEGLEVYYRGYPPEVVRALAELAARHRLLATGGTDYHGDDGPYELAARAVDVPSEVGRRVRAALARRRAAATATDRIRRTTTRRRATLVGR
jgi:predicted metal-dependent phosphoesterase TrpH